MFRFIRSAATSRPQRAGARSPGQEIRAEGGEDASTSDSPRYPPYDSGIEIRKIDEIVATQSALIGRIYRTAGVSREEFAERFEPALRNLARYVHLVPATAASNHRLEGGLFRFSLEVALYAMQAANASVFPTSGGVERRYFMQPKWSLATFLAGLCSQTYRVINNMVIVDRANAQWPPLLVPLYDWALSVRTDAYFIRWLQERDDAGAQASSAYLVSRIIAPEVLQYLCADNNQVIPFMTAAITGAQISASDNPIARIVAPLTSRVIEEDLKRTPTHYGRGSIGFHIEPHLIDAMRRLLRSGTWSCNHREAVVWVGTDGVFVKWDTAAADVIQLLNTDSFVGVPRDPDTLADMLCESGVLERTPERARYWTITTPDTAEVLDNVVKLRQRDLIFPRGFDFSRFESVTLRWRSAPAEALFGGEPGAGKGRTGTPPDALPNQAQPTPSDPSGTIPPAPAPTRAAPPDPDGRANPRGASRSRSPRQDRASSGEPGKATDRARDAPDPASTLGSSAPEPPVSGCDNAVSAAGPSPSQPEKLLGSLQKENARLLQEILDSVLADKPIGVTASLPQGYGISIDSIPTRGQPVMDLLDELAAKQWLWVDKTKPTRKLHRIEVGTAVCRMLVLRPEIAQGLGLPWAGRFS